MGNVYDHIFMVGNVLVSPDILTVLLISKVLLIRMWKVTW